MIALAVYFLSLCQGKLSEVPHDSDTAHIIISFLEEVFFQDNRNLILLQKMFIQKFLRIALHFNLCLAVICHFGLAGAIVASVVINVQNTWLERALPVLPCSAGARECQRISLLQSEAPFEHVQDWLRQQYFVSCNYFFKKFCFPVTVFLMLGLCCWHSNTPEGGSNSGSNSSCCSAHPK